MSLEALLDTTYQKDWAHLRVESIILDEGIVSAGAITVDDITVNNDADVTGIMTAGAIVNNGRFISPDYGQLTVHNNNIKTPISGTGWFEPISTDTTVSSNVSDFTLDSTAVTGSTSTNRLIYNGLNTAYFRIGYGISMRLLADGAGPVDLVTKTAMFINYNGAALDPKIESHQTLLQGSYGSVSSSGLFELNTGDIIDIRVSMDQAVPADQTFLVDQINLCITSF